MDCCLANDQGYRTMDSVECYFTGNAQIMSFAVRATDPRTSIIAYPIIIRANDAYRDAFRRVNTIFESFKTCQAQENALLVS